MSIHCQKCNYHFTKLEVCGYMAAEGYKLFREVILPALIDLYSKRGIKEFADNEIETILLGALNLFETKCHVCMKFCGWSRKSEISDTNMLLNNVHNQKDLQ